MKKVRTVFSLILLIHLVGVVCAAYPSTCSHLFHKDGRITKKFQDIFRTLKAPHIPQNLEESFAVVQGKHTEGYTWLRTGERYSSENDESLTLAQAQKIIKFCKGLGLFRMTPLPTQKIQGCLVMGSTLKRVRAEVAYVNSWKRLHETNPPIVFVGGERMLDEKAGETQSNLYDLPKGMKRQDYVIPDPQNRPILKDEREMIKLVAQQSLSPHFTTVHFVLPDKKKDAPRATTMDGMKMWFEGNPKGGTYVMVSSNPYIPYQELVCQRAAFLAKRQDIVFVGCGSAISLQEYLKTNGTVGLAKILLDNLARIIYEMKAIADVKKKGS